MHCDAEIGEQPSAAIEEKHSYPNAIISARPTVFRFSTSPSSPVRAMKLGATPRGSTTTNRVTNAFRANCQRSSSMSESIGKKCGRKLVHQASAGDIERFAGGMRGIAGCQKKSSLGNFVMLGVFSQGRKF